MRYLGQAYGLDVPIPVREKLTEEDLLAACRTFHETHRAQYGYAIEGEIIEFLDFKTTALGSVRALAIPKIAKKEKTGPKSVRRVMLDGEGDLIECPVYERSHLGKDFELDGPALIEEMYSTTLVGRNDHMSVDEYGNVMMEIRGRSL
jgi:N-methylhydantoinase A